MTHQYQAVQAQELAALYALGALDGEEAETFARHLEAGCAICQAEVDSLKEVVDYLGTSVRPVRPQMTLRNRLMDRLGIAPQAPPAREGRSDVQETGLTFVRAAEGIWQEPAPGVSIKTLYVDRLSGRITALARMAAGSSYLPHRHAAAEELYVLEGTCFCGGQLLHPGDYHRAETGSIHTETSTSDGCLMLVIFSPDNEMLPQHA